MTEKINPTTRPRNAFEFATVAAARAKQLQRGCVPKIDGSAKIARRAQQEVANGLVQQLPQDESEEQAQ
jgi:DNA-directed RNA polymerase subunit K/omega